MAREKVDERVAMEKMKALLQQGAVMLSETCPICGLPLFKLKSGDVVCPIHGKVFLVSSDEEARDVEISETIKLLEYEAVRRMREIMGGDFEPSEILSWLRIVEEAERIRNLISERESKKSSASTGTSQQ